MSPKNYKDLSAEILLERKENRPQANSICKGQIIAKNSSGLYIDINKTFEGFISSKDLGTKNLDSFQIGELIEFTVLSEDKNTDGVFRASIKQIEDNHKWGDLEKLKDSNLDLTIHKVLKSGIEVIIQATKQVGFIPFGYLDSKQNAIKDLKREEWIGVHIPGRLHELDQSKNKIILNNKVICDEQKQAKALELMSMISIGQEIEGEVVRTTDFGVFVDIGGIDALIPSSELSYKRFKKPSDIIQVGQKVKAKIFKIEPEQKRVAMSIKQANLDPWTILPQEFKPGHQLKAKVITKAEFGVFAEVLPGVEALFHKSNFSDDTNPEIGEEYLFEILNIDVPKKRMGIKLAANQATQESESKSAKELEHV